MGKSGPTPVSSRDPLSGDAIVSSKFRIPPPLLLAALLAAIMMSAVFRTQVAAQTKPAEGSEASDSDAASKKKDTGPMKSETFSGLALRSVGPAMVSGR